jgi:thioredoxin reductase (NADPH)
MSESREELTSAVQAVSPAPVSSSNSDFTFRHDLAFPKLSGDMLQRLRSYGQEESVAKDTCLYTYGDRDTDMLVILSGEIESRLLGRVHTI